MIWLRRKRKKRPPLEILPVVQDISNYREVKEDIPAVEAKRVAERVVHTHMQNEPTTFIERIQLVDFMEDEDMDIALALEWAYEGTRNKEDKKQIVTDPQNVHDSNIMNDIYEQTTTYLPVAKEEAKRELLEAPWVPREIKNVWQNSIFQVNDIYEIDHATRVWMALKDKPSGVDAMKDAVQGCYENGNMVCAMGRVARIHGALVDQTEHENLGVVRTKGALRQTFYADVAKLTQEGLPEVELKESIRNLHGKYEAILPDIDFLIEESISYI